MSKTVLDAIEQKFGPQTLPTIHNNVRLKEASGFGKHILEYDPLCSGAMDYRRVAKEIIRVYQDEQ
ncbi:MAG: hypothetical protein GTN99_03465, partial [Candidatus Dadabacteria bacterium]|nr:hypothetical protein [Candidatus Dadabacteria bacterium]NIT13319.1 hypothetical protein [Candidatus Dadabacteria bacterium]